MPKSILLLEEEPLDGDGLLRLTGRLVLVGPLGSEPTNRATDQLSGVHTLTRAVVPSRLDQLLELHASGLVLEVEPFPMLATVVLSVGLVDFELHDVDGATVSVVVLLDVLDVKDSLTNEDRFHLVGSFIEID